jgi:Glycolipid transfer protein (GLTP)
MTFFDKMKRSYKDVDTTGGINTTQFLEASESLVTLFGISLKNTTGHTIDAVDLLGSTAFAVVKNDMNGNIKVARPAPLTPGLQLTFVENS